MHATSAKKVPAAPGRAVGPAALVGSPEQRAAAEFIAGLQRAGLDLAKLGACDDMQVPALAAAGMLGVKRQTLALWRCTRSQPLRVRCLICREGCLA